jgi:hypothetical protein
MGAHRPPADVLKDDNVHRAYAPIDPQEQG